jgi:hypothetical protein
MKTKEKEKKDFDTVKTFRDIKDKISADVKEMDFVQFSAYLLKTKLSK